MNGAAILCIPENEPERLFTDPAKLEAEHHALRKRWHPDAGGDSKVFAHIEALRRVADQRVAKGLWQPHGRYIVTGKDGKRFEIKHHAKRSFELGEMLIGKNIVTFVIRSEFGDQVINGLRHIGKIRYPTEKFRASLAQHLPHVARSVETADGWVLCMRKDPDEVLLSDLIKHMGQIPPKHTAWVISSLLNLACFLEVNETSINGLTPETVFVSPKRHAVSLYGGWWYAAGYGKLLRHLPPDTHPLASVALLKHKVANGQLDLACIKAIGRACLGDPSGGTLRGRADVPAPFNQFLQLPPAKSAFVEYENWPKVLEASFGPRRYHELKISGEDVYPQGV